jgi:hypothetical protein
MATKRKTAPKKPTRVSRTKTSSQKPEYWFAAKRYGYGWGRALTWQGWLVYGTFLASVVWYFAWATHRVAAGQTYGWSEETFIATGFFLLMAIALPVLVTICAMTGEPARWRWGSTKRK